MQHIGKFKRFLECPVVMQREVRTVEASQVQSTRRGRRRNTMLKICDFLVVRVAPFNVLAPQAGSETSIDWNALEFSAGEEQEEHCAPGRPWAGGVMAEEWAPSPREHSGTSPTVRERAALV